jgi:hypothetical protein
MKDVLCHQSGERFGLLGELVKVDGHLATSRTFQTYSKETPAYR